MYSGILCNMFSNNNTFENNQILGHYTDCEMTWFLMSVMVIQMICFGTLYAFYCYGLLRIYCRRAAQASRERIHFCLINSSHNIGRIDIKIGMNIYNAKISSGIEKKYIYSPILTSWNVGVKVLIEIRTKHK